MLRILIFLSILQYITSIKCRSCYSYNNQACVNAPDCESDICLYEQLNGSNGVVHVLRTCWNRGPVYKFDDGVTMTNLNQCVTRTTSIGKYYVSMCTTQDYCNMDCRTEQQPVVPTLPPIEPPPLGSVTCYDCVTTDGTDCTYNTCQGAYCLYERRLIGNQMTLKKSCLLQPLILLDDDTAVTNVDVCEVRNTATSRYFVKICNNLNLCNNYCSPGQTPPIIPQRQPLVRCYDCESTNSDCFTGSCEGNYCIFEKQLRVGTSRSYYRKSCSALSYAQYPDSTTTGSANRCETKNINDVQYNVKVCNTGNLCNEACGEEVTCTECSSDFSDDCTGTTCQGAYCVFVRSKSQLDPTKRTVKKSCSPVSTASFPDNSAYNDFGHCQYKNLGSVQHTIKICNTTFCNTPCSDIAMPTPSPSQSSSHHFNILIVLLFLTPFLIL